MAANAQNQEDVFQTTQEFAGYVSKPDITAILPTFLVKGSKNVLVDFAQRIRSRNGYVLYRQASTGGGAIQGSYEWRTSTGSEFSLRSYDRTLEFDWNGQYNTLLSGLPSSVIEFAKVLDYAEQQDVLLFVLNEQQMRRWSGGVSKVASSTSTTLTKQGVQTAKTSISFTAGNGTTVNPIITNVTGGFTIAGFAAGDTLTVSGSTNNTSSNFTIASVTDTVITLIMSNVLVTEAVGQTITIYNQNGPTWKSQRFFSTISNRAITYKGVSYTYTGGETTDTLTGLTSFPTVTAGDATWQTPDVIALPSSITSPFPGFTPDLIGVQLNMVFLASTKSPVIFWSKNIDYTDFTLTSPRAPGDPGQQPLTSGRARCITPVDTDSMILNVQSTLIFGSGNDAFDQLDFHMSADNTAELVRIIRYKTAIGAGLISKNAITPVKNNTVYISREPALDGLSQGNLESPDGKKNVPISDLIKDDFDAYNFSKAHVIYYKRAIYIALPSNGIVLIYDMMRNLWQPPQTLPISRFAIIGDLLYGHSSITNETYQLFSGTNDNGAPIEQVATFAYNNAGNRARLKNMSEYWSDGYISVGGTLNLGLNYGFNGSLGTQNLTISGNDQTVTLSPVGSPLGDNPLGEEPLGGAPIEPVGGIPGTTSTLLRFWQVDTLSVLADYIEFYASYSMNTLDAQFALVAHGSNQWDAGTSPVSHKK